MSRYLANEAEAVQPWKKLLGKWLLIEDSAQEKTWQNKCPLFHAFIGQKDKGYEFQLTEVDGQVLFTQDLESETIQEAYLEADFIIAEFLTLGAMLLAGQVAPGEVRFCHVSHSPDGKLFGLSTDGILYVRTYPSKGGLPSWSPIKMNVLKETVEP